MKITAPLTDDAVLKEIGARIMAVRLDKNITQAELARRASVSKRTVERLESGIPVQFVAFLRVCRALDLLERLEVLLPAPAPSPMALLKLQGRTRRRARTPSDEQEQPTPWTWGDGRGR
jgi:transcriptional regulator with XRE-family HTH domain